jgi:hypothetical protein
MRRGNVFFNGAPFNSARGYNHFTAGGHSFSLLFGGSGSNRRDGHGICLDSVCGHTAGRADFGRQRYGLGNADRRGNV